MQSRAAAVLSLLVLSPLFLGPAFAAEVVTTYIGPTDTEKSKTLDFAEKDCEEECHMASLICEETMAINFTYADVSSKSAAKIIRSENQAISLVINKKEFSFFVNTLTFSEMTGSWWVDARFMADPKDLLAALEKAKDFKARAGDESMTLPVTAEFQTWASACRM